MWPDLTILDIIGAFIGFASVMLLLSMVVTALVQATQATTGMRGRNLRLGLEVLLESLSKDTDGPTRRRIAAKALDSPIRAGLRVTGPAVSWIDPDKLSEVLKSAGAKIEGDGEDLKKQFQGMEGQLQKRFQGLISAITIIWSFLIAFFFQVHALDLLRDLSIDEDLRARYVAEAEGLVENAAVSLRRMGQYTDVSGEALRRLEKEYPDIKEYIERVGGIGKDRASLVSEFRTATRNSPVNLDAVADEYAALLEELYQEQREVALREARVAVRELSRFDIRAWPHGWKFYGKFGNWFGVLMTTGLLTFGAPFWFERLRDAIALKDVLDPRKKKEKKKKKR